MTAPACPRQGRGALSNAARGGCVCAPTSVGPTPILDERREAVTEEASSRSKSVAPGSLRRSEFSRPASTGSPLTLPLALLGLRRRAPVPRGGLLGTPAARAKGLAWSLRGQRKSGALSARGSSRHRRPELRAERLSESRPRTGHHRGRSSPWAIITQRLDSGCIGTARQRAEVTKGAATAL